MNPIRNNIFANFLGSGWIALMNLIFIPIYINFIGIEAYGLIGFYTILLALFSILDIGLSATVNRELARYNALGDQMQQKADLVRTLEVIYWVIGGGVFFIVLSLSELIAYQWIEGTALSPGEIQQAVIIMGIMVAVQWPLSFYQGGLMGLEHQVLLNKVSASLATLRGGGTVLVLWLISPTIQAFFVWQIIISALEVLLVAKSLWKKILPSIQKPRFQIKVLQNVWRFAAGMSGITLVTLVLTNADKIILSKMLSLELFGYYSLAFSAAGVIFRVTTPIYTAFFPSLSKLVAKGDQQGLTRQYHLGSQFVSVTILPLVLFIAFFSKELLLIWTRNPTIVENTQTLLTYLVIGNGLNGLMYIPYALELAHGWTKLTFYKNLIAVMILIPLMTILIQRYQAVGAAIVWIILNGSYVLLEPQFLHRRFLKSKIRTWYINDVGLPLVAAFMVVGLGHQLILINGNQTTVYIIGSLTAVLGLAIIAAFLSASQVRRWLLSKIR